MTDRCDVTDLLVDECACPKHRGGDDVIVPPGAVVEDGLPFVARHAGWCARCRRDIEPGEVIARTDEGRYVHAGADRCQP